MTSPRPPNGLPTTPRSRDAWPEYKGGDAGKVLKELKEAGNNAFIQPPGPQIRRPETRNEPELNDDVWLYTDLNNQVVIIPKRGRQHDSPVSGWEELVGTGWETSLQTILDQVIGVRLVYGIAPFQSTKDEDLNRVIVTFDDHENVEIKPRLG